MTRGQTGEEPIDEIETRIMDTLCDRIDESVHMSDNKSDYLFIGQYYWQIERNFTFIGVQSYVHNKWAFAISTPLDTAFTLRSCRFKDKTVFIIGNQWWRVTNNEKTEASN